jgi:hypothetical protein
MCINHYSVEGDMFLKFSFPGLFFICLIIPAINSCSSSAVDSVESKFNPALKQKIVQAEKNNSEELIDVFIKTDTELDSVKKTELEKTGIRIGSIEGQIVTAAGNYKQIIAAAKLEFVNRIELSQTIEIK